MAVSEGPDLKPLKKEKVILTLINYSDLVGFSKSAAKTQGKSKRLCSAILEAAFDWVILNTFTNS